MEPAVSCGAATWSRMRIPRIHRNQEVRENADKKARKRYERILSDRCLTAEIF